MRKPVTLPSGGEIETINLKEALEKRYLDYALSTIMHRALPDARDGLKPVHRRILHAMRLLRLDPRSAPKKCARIVGDVMGQYHPHGDQSIYDALVRMAQDFAQRYPLADGQGNFGNIDGDNAAAMRYTEARMTEVARLLLEGIDEDAVDFRETYDQTNEEPVVLPAAFPNLLANGSQGIAVGMATSIPPHNAAELCDAALHLIAKPGATSEQLMQYVPGPDLPTGGIIVDTPAAMAETYRTGRGSFRVRARWAKFAISTAISADSSAKRQGPPRPRTRPPSTAPLRVTAASVEGAGGAGEAAGRHEEPLEGAAHAGQGHAPRRAPPGGGSPGAGV